ncbi:MAG: quinone-dependent dihydroorotate dehydrogenase [Alphaproteobacteria bacterium]
MNLYRLARPFLFQLDAETAHHLALTLLKKGFGPTIKSDYDRSLHTQICGLHFTNPVGLAAGFDKNGEVIDQVLKLGFGFTELGSITPLPQTGNPRPRMFRVTEARAVINRLGFNSQGMDVCLPRIISYQFGKTGHGIVGINIGKNKESTDAAADYVRGIKLFAPYADYITVNISSPNTPGLRDLQGREQLSHLLREVMTAQSSSQKQPPIFVKIAPDQTEQQQDDIAEVVLASGVHGMIIGNTTISRPSSLSERWINEVGGLSGRPLFDLSTQMLSTMYKKTGGKIPLIGCGGISSGEDAYAKIRAGASLIQLYTALVYEGPELVQRINHELSQLLRRDGFKSVSEAVGANHK